MPRMPNAILRSTLLTVAMLTACKARGPYALDRSWPLMGATLRMHVSAPDSATAARAAQAAHDEVMLVDNLMSTRQDNSEISVVNRRAGTGDITYVSPSTTSVVAAALEYAQDTGGALDISIGPVVRVWGFYDNEGRVPTSAQLAAARRLTGLPRIAFNQSERTLLLPERGMQLDLGALAHGFALDRAVRALREGGATAGRVELGGSVSVFGPPPEEKQTARIVDPGDTARVVATIALDSGSASTSSSYEGSFESAGVRYSRIIDPRTGRPVPGVSSVTVLGPTGLASDALATALHVLGAEQGCPVAARAGVEAVWVTVPAESTQTLQITATPGMDALLRVSDARPHGRCTLLARPVHSLRLYSQGH